MALDSNVGVVENMIIEADFDVEDRITLMI